MRPPVHARLSLQFDWNLIFLTIYTLIMLLYVMIRTAHPKLRQYVLKNWHVQQSNISTMIHASWHDFCEIWNTWCRVMYWKKFSSIMKHFSLMFRKTWKLSFNIGHPLSFWSASYRFENSCIVTSFVMSVDLYVSFGGPLVVLLLENSWTLWLLRNCWKFNLPAWLWNVFTRLCTCHLQSISGCLFFGS